MSNEFAFGILMGALITFLVDSLFFIIYKKEIYERLHKELTNKKEIANLKQEPVLDKIRAEIEQLPTSECTKTYRRYIVADDFKKNVLVILDKYKVESEG